MKAVVPIVLLFLLFLAFTVWGWEAALDAHFSANDPPARIDAERNANIALGMQLNCLAFVAWLGVIVMAIRLKRRGAL